MKFKLGLTYLKFTRMSEQRIFPQGKEKEIDASKQMNGKAIELSTIYM